MDGAALRGLSEFLGHGAISSSNMIIVDLTAAVVCNPGAFARDQLAPACVFERAGQCLLLLGASPELSAAPRPVRGAGRQRSRPTQYLPRPPERVARGNAPAGGFAGDEHGPVRANAAATVAAWTTTA